MPDELNPEIERTLDELADLVGKSLNGESNDFVARENALLKALVMNGYSRQSVRSLTNEVQSRVNDKRSSPSTSRGGAMSSIMSNLDARFKALTRWESDSPADELPPNSAKISSSSDS